MTEHFYVTDYPQVYTDTKAENTSPKEDYFHNSQSLKTARKNGWNGNATTEAGKI